MSAPRRRVRDRDVLLATAAAAAVVFVLYGLTQLVPGLGDLLGFAPVVIGLLVLLTVLVLAGALRPKQE